MAGELSRPEYSARYGPTTGDRIRLGDTDLLARIERDESSYGDEVLRGWGKTLRTGIMTSAELPAASELDLIVTNVVVIDPVLGVLKANIGVKDGVIVGWAAPGTRTWSTTPISSSAPTPPPSTARATSRRPAASTPTSTSSSPV